MTRDIDTLRHWFLAVVSISAVGATSVPVIYSLSKWWKKTLGRLFMLQSIAFAILIDMAVLFQFWKPKDILVTFWIEVSIFTAIAVSTTGLTWWVWKLNLKMRKSLTHGED